MKSGLRHISTGSILLHLSFWGLYILSEYFANLIHMHPGHEWRFFKSVFLTLPTLLIPVYFILWYVVPAFLLKEKWVPFILWITGIAVVIFFGRIQWAQMIAFLEYGRGFEIPVSKLLKNIIRDYAIIALAVCISILHDYRRRQRAQAQLIKAKAEAEIKLLKGQLHPHFLFNSLNNIYSLALTGSDQTADSILRLTSLLEFLLYRANQDHIPVRKEVELIDQYIELEKLRYGDHLHVTTDWQLTSESIAIPPLLLLPFAENCFKHGGPGNDGLFKIDIHLRINAEEMKFVVTNSKRKTTPDIPKENGGIGLDNLRQRLALLFPNRHRLDIQQDDAQFQIVLIIRPPYVHV